MHCSKFLHNCQELPHPRLKARYAAPFHQAIAKIEHVIAQHQDKSDAAWEAYERAQNSL